MLLFLWNYFVGYLVPFAPGGRVAELLRRLGQALLTGG
jgi:hypothetical protein